jgi:hypothetical protein
MAYVGTYYRSGRPVVVGDKDWKFSMPEYRLYTLLSGDKIAGPATQVECSSDEEAISQAKKFINGLDIEVWQDARLIARLQSPRR